MKGLWLTVLTVNAFSCGVQTALGGWTWAVVGASCVILALVHLVGDDSDNT